MPRNSNVFDCLIKLKLSRMNVRLLCIALALACGKLASFSFCWNSGELGAGERATVLVYIITLVAESLLVLPRKPSQGFWLLVRRLR